MEAYLPHVAGIARSRTHTPTNVVHGVMC